MSAIRSIETVTVSVPLAAPVAFSSRSVTRREYTLVRITDADGAHGIGFCYPGHKAASLASTAVAELLAPVILDGDANDIERHWNAMYQESLLHGRTGSVMRAISAIDIALWDLKARASGLPLHKLLGAARSSVPAYASGGYYLEGKGPKQLAEEVRSYVDAGFSAVKIKVGRFGYREEIRRVEAAREAIGPDTLLFLDANNAFTNLPDAIRNIRAWEAFEPSFVEEPFSPDDIANHARLAEKVDVPIATGEIEAGRWRTKELLDQRAAVILQQDAAVCGGISELQKIAHLASAHGVELFPHWFHDLHAPLVSAFSSGRFVEYFVGNGVFNFGELIDAQLRIENGTITLHDTPGLGFDFLGEAVDRFKTHEWTVIR